MTNVRRETRRLALSFIVSGSVTLGLGVLALAWPETMLIAGMLTVGLISVLFGLNQIFSAASIRAQAPMWRLLLAHGILTLLFGLLTVGATALTFKMAFGAVTIWLGARAILAIGVVVRSRPTKWIRYSLIASALVDLASAALVIAIPLIAIPVLTIFEYLFFGSVYAVVFGISQLVAGISLRRHGFEDVPTLAEVWSDDINATHIGRPRHANS